MTVTDSARHDGTTPASLDSAGGGKVGEWRVLK
jgi:hypothetical protein